jgi:hypothetical protein
MQLGSFAFASIDPYVRNHQAYIIQHSSAGPAGQYIYKHDAPSTTLSTRRIRYDGLIRIGLLSAYGRKLETRRITNRWYIGLYSVCIFVGGQNSPKKMVDDGNITYFIIRYKPDE